MPFNPNITNGFGYAAWCFGPAIVYYHRNDPETATVAIGNLGQNAMNWIAQYGGPVGYIKAIHDELSCMNAASNVRNWLDRILYQEQPHNTQGPLFDLGLALGKAWTYCRPDGAQPDQWQQETNSARQEMLQAESALGAFPHLYQTFLPTFTQIIFDIGNASSFPSNVVDTKFTGLFSAIPNALMQSGP